jgi:uncharacterized protein (DUF302 family)
MNFDVPYAITRRIPDTTIKAVRDRVTAALAAEGFGVLTEIDVQSTLEKKLGIATAPYLILGACNPKLAHEALSKEPAIGLMLPCNVVLAEDGRDTVVSAASPRAMFAVVGDAAARGLAAIAEDAEERLRRALDRLVAGQEPAPTSLGPARSVAAFSRPRFTLRTIDS